MQKPPSVALSGEVHGRSVAKDAGASCGCGDTEHPERPTVQPARANPYPLWGKVSARHGVYVCGPAMRRLAQKPCTLAFSATAAKDCPEDLERSQ
jgi:hypothetical protein